MNAVRSVREICNANEVYVALTDLPVINNKDCPKTIETLTEFLVSFFGETKTPLGYFVRKTVELPVGNDPRDAYPTIAAKMIRRATHNSMVYSADNQKVWDTIAKMTRDQ